MEGFHVRLRRLSEYGSVACLVERPTRETQVEQYSDTILEETPAAAPGPIAERKGDEGWGKGTPTRLLEQTEQRGTDSFNLHECRIAMKQHLKTDLTTPTLHIS